MSWNPIWEEIYNQRSWGRYPSEDLNRFIAWNFYKVPDHAASLEPHELKAMVAAIRNIEKAMGDGVKKPSPSEVKNIPIVRKSIVAQQLIKKGERFSEENLTVKRPGTGISPMEWDNILGKTADREYQTDDLIK